MAPIVDADDGRDAAENAYYEAAADPDYVRRSAGFAASTCGVYDDAANVIGTPIEIRLDLPRFVWRQN